jgi:8-amino-7-oxononanoate synthase
MNIESKIGPRITLEGRSVDYFGGTSYYSLHTHPAVLQASIEATMRWGIGIATSRRGLGNNDLLDKLEEAAAAFLDEESSVLLPTGYMSPLAGTLCLRDEIETIFIDENSHSSDMIAAKATGARVVLFKHLNPEDLESKIRKCLHKKARPLIMSDGVFPSTGEIAPLPDYVQIAEQYNGQIWLDEAHSFGITGPNGRGSKDTFDCQSERILSGGTLGKAFGGFGGIIPCSKRRANKLRQNPVYTGASPLPMPAAAAALAGINLLQSDPSFRKRLHQNTITLRQALKKLGLEIPDSEIPIIAFQHENETRMADIQRALFAKGIWIQHSLNYSGLPHGGLLRIVSSSEHSAEQIARLSEALAEVL